MRDRHFVAAHRGGPLDRESHATLARWASDCAERVLPLFNRCSGDTRPFQALEIARAWANGTVKTGTVINASVAAHAAARQTEDTAAAAAARSAGHAVATAHFADHSIQALLYVWKALEASGGPAGSEVESQLAKLPAHLRDQVSTALNVRLKRLRMV